MTLTVCPKYASTSRADACVSKNIRYHQRRFTSYGEDKESQQSSDEDSANDRLRKLQGDYAIRLKGADLKSLATRIMPCGTFA